MRDVTIFVMVGTKDALKEEGSHPKEFKGNKTMLSAGSNKRHVRELSLPRQ